MSLRSWLTRLLSRTRPIRTRRPARPTARPRLEALEDRLAPATVTWTGTDDHTTWTDANNWLPMVVPGAGDAVVIPSNGSTSGETVVYSADAVESVGSITSSLPIDVAAGILQTTGSGIALSNSASLTISGGADLSFLGGTQTLSSSDSTGSVVFGDSTTGNEISLDGGVRLTIDSGFTIAGNTGMIGPVFTANPTGTLVNQGTISADVSGGTITLAQAAITNSSTLEAQHGGDLTLATTITGSGTISTDTGHGSTLVQDDATIEGNTISGPVDVEGSSNEISGVTLGFGSTLNLSGNNVVENVTAGLTLFGGTVSIAGGASLDVGVVPDESVSIGGSGNITFADSNTNNSITLQNDASASIAFGVTIGGEDGSIVSTGGILTNNGTIAANVSGGTILLQSEVTNTTTVEALNGGTLEIGNEGDVTGGTVMTDSGHGSQIENDPGGTITNASLIGTFGGSSSEGVWSADTIASGNTVNLVASDARVDSGLTLNGTLNVDAGGLLGFGFIPNESETLSGTGSVVFDGDPSNALSLDAGVTLTVAGGITIGGQNGLIGPIGFAGPTGSLINQGTIAASVAGGTITLQQAAVTNSGTLKATNGGTLTISTSVSGAGTITTDTGHGSKVVQSNGSIQNNTIAGVLTVAGGSNTLSAVTVNSTGVVTVSGGSVIENVTKGLTLTNGAIDIRNGGTLALGVAVNETETIGGTGQIVFDQVASNALTVQNGVTAIIGANVLVHGQNGEINGTDGTLQNNGTIANDVSGGDLVLRATITNGNTVEAQNGGKIEVDDTLTGGTVTTDSGQGSLIQNDSNGTIAGASLSGTFGSSSSEGAWSADTIASGATANAVDTNVRVTGGLTLNGTLNVQGGTTLGFGVVQGETESVTGTGSIVFDADVSNSIALDAGVKLTIGSGITIDGKNGTIGPAVFASPTGTLTNQGTIAASVAGGTITLSSAVVTNSNTLSAENGGNLTVSTTVTGSGDITSDTGQGSKVVQSNGSIQGNTVECTLSVVGNSNILSGTILGPGGLLSVSGSGVIENVTRGLALLGGNASIALGGDLAFGVATDESETVSGTGHISFDNNASNSLTVQNGVTLTIDPGITIDGSAGRITGSDGTLVNEGTVAADVSGGDVDVSTTVTNFSGNNLGTVEALNGGTLEVSGAITGGGVTTDSGNGSKIQNDTSGTIASTSLSGTFGGVSADGAWQTDTIALGAVVDLVDTGARVTQGLTLNGTLNIQGGSDLGFGVIANESETLAGSGSIVFDANTSNELSLDAGVTLSVGTGITIDGKNATIGPAAFATPTGSLVNSGTIAASVSGGTITVQPNTLTNHGTLSVVLGGKMVVSPSGSFTNYNASTNTLTGGSLNVAGTFQLDGASIATNAANITLDGTAALIVDQSDANVLVPLATNAAAGSLTLEAGRTLTTAGAFSNAGAVTIDATTGASALSAPGGYTQTGGTTTLVAGGTLNGTVLLQGGTLQGAGTLAGNLTNAATVAPGHNTAPLAAGTISVSGTYTQTSAGTLDVKIGGAGNYDQLTVAGAATLAGTVSASLFNAFVPAVGTTFADVLDFASVTGDFTARNGFALGNQGVLFEDFNPAGSAVRLNLDVDQAPSVVTPPASQTFDAGQTATFSVTVSGTPTPSVAWQVSIDGGHTYTPITGATSATLALNDVTPSQNNTMYEAVLTNVVDSVTSAPATLTVDYVTITGGPGNTTVNAGQTATFSASATSNPTPANVVWLVSSLGGPFMPLTGQTAPTLTLNAVTPALNGNQYEAQFSNSAGITETTAPATLTVDYITITSGPQPVSADAGQSATFSFVASANPSASIQWEVSTNNGTSFSALSGQTSPTLTLTNLQPGQNGNQYAVQLTNSSGTMTSAGALLTVNYITITTQPTDEAVAPGGTVTFTTADTSTPSAATIQWQVSTDGTTFNNITGENAPTLTLTNVPSGDNGNLYRATFTNAAGVTATSNAGTLGVGSILIETSPGSPTVTAGGTVTLSASAASSPQATAQWQVSTDETHWTDVGGAIDADVPTLTLTNVQPSQDGDMYQVVFTNSTGSMATSPGTLTVQYVTVTTQPTSATVNAGQSATFTAAALSDPSGATVQWMDSLDAGPFGTMTGQTSPTLMLNGVTAVMNGTQYEAVFTNSTGQSATSTPATLTVDYLNVTGPSNTTVLAGSTASFTVSITSNPAAAVQWQESVGGQPFASITGATGTTLLLTNVTAAQDGAQYQAVVSNSAGTVDSSVATLTVASFTDPSDVTVLAGQTATFTVSNVATTSVQWLVSIGGGAFAPVTADTFPGGVTVSGETTDTLTISGTTAGLNGNQFEAAFTDAVGTQDTGAATLTVGTLTSPSSVTALAGQTATFTASASVPTTGVQWLFSVNSGAFAPVTAGTFSGGVTVSGATTDTLTISGTSAALSGDQFEAAFTNGTGTVDTGAAGLTVGALSNPSGATVLFTETATFTASSSVATSGVQWLVSIAGGAFVSLSGGVFAGGPTLVSGETTDTLILNLATDALNGDRFEAAFTNSLGTVDTGAATLTVTSIVDPVSVTTLAGLNAVFGAAAISPPAGMTVQWAVSVDNGPFSVVTPTTFPGVTVNFSGADIPGYTTTILTLSGVTTAMNGDQFIATFSDAGASINTGESSLIVESAPPFIITPPTAQVTSTGGSATFTAAAGGGPAPSVQWQVIQNGVATNVTASTFPGVAVSGATSGVLTLAGVTAAMDQDQFQAVFTNPYGQATTVAARLTVQYAPRLLESPTSIATFTNGQSVTFAAAAQGEPAPSVQWYQVVNGSPKAITGATGPTLTFTATTALKGAEYEATFNNGIASVTTSVAYLQTAPVKGLTAPKSATVALGKAATFTVGTITNAVQWQVSTNGGVTFANVAGATTKSYTFTPTVGQNFAEFRALVTSGSIQFTTSAATLTISGIAPTVVAGGNPSNVTVSPGQLASFTAQATGSPTMTASWMVSINSGHTFVPATSTLIPGLTVTTIFNPNTGIWMTTLLFPTKTNGSQNGYIFEAVFKNAVHSMTTGTATLTD